MPPAPIGATISYGPRRVPVTGNGWRDYMGALPEWHAVPFRSRALSGGDSPLPVPRTISRERAGHVHPTLTRAQAHQPVANDELAPPQPLLEGLQRSRASPFFLID